MQKNNRYVIYDVGTGRIDSIISSPIGVPDYDNVTQRHIVYDVGSISANDYKIDLNTLLPVPYVPVVTTEQKIKRNNAAIIQVATRLQIYLLLGPLVENQQELQAYIQALETAISTQPREDLILPDTPEWFI